LALSLGADFDLGAGLYLQAECAGETHFLRMRDRQRDPVRGVVAFALRGSLGLGKRF
jgi:hypothetical protein